MRYFFVCFLALFVIRFDLLADNNSNLEIIYAQGKSLLDDSESAESRLIFSKLSQLELNPDDSLTFWIIDHLSDSHYLEGDINGTIFWYLEELRAYENCLGDRSSEAGKMHYWLGESFREKGDFLQASNHFNTALDIFEIDPPNDDEYEAVINNCIDFFSEIKNDAKSLKLYEVGKSKFGSKTVDQASIDRKHNLALALATFDPDRAYAILTECANQYLAYDLRDEAFKTFSNIVSILFKEKRFKEAISILQKTNRSDVQYQILTTKFQLEVGLLSSADSSLQKLNRSTALSKQEKLIVKQLTASLLQKTGKDNDIALVKAFHLRCDLIEDILVEQHSFLGLIDFHDWFLNLDELSRETLAGFKEIEDRFLIGPTEFDRLLRLFEALKKRKLKWHESGISYDSNDHLEAKFNKQNNNDSWSNYLEQLRKLKISTVQKQMNEKETIIHCLEANEQIHLLILEKDRVFVKRLPFRIQRPGRQNEALDYRSDAACKAILDHVDLNKYSNIVIIPDQATTTLPFEAVKINAKYLIETHQVRYVSSLIKSEVKQHAITENSTYLGFAPNIALANGSNEVSFDEIINAASYFSQSTLKAGREASETAFKENVGSFDIVHLVTHSNAGTLLLGSDSKNDGQLEFGELSDIKLSTRLLILSSCNTGLGETDPGNGLKSSAQEFSNAGIPEVLFTTFKIPDKQSSEIMSRFFTEINKPISTVAALRKAKLQFIQESDYNLRDPYFWVGPRIIERNWITNENPELIKSELTSYYCIFFIVIIYLLRTESYFRRK